MKRVFLFEYLTGSDAAIGLADLAAQGLQMRDAVAGDLLRSGAFEVSVAAAGAAPNAALPALTARPHPGESTLDFVARQAARHPLCWIIAPETDGMLTTLQRAVPPARWLGCDAAAVVLASSKQATTEQLARCGLVTPLNMDRDALVQRWVVKPDDGAGAVDTRVHTRRHDALDDLAQRRDAGLSSTLEPWVEGPAWSLSLLCTRHGAELLSANHQHIEIDATGTLRFEGVTPNALPAGDAQRVALQRLADRIAAAVPGLRGFVGVDFVWHRDAGPVVIEINPRVTSAYVGLSAALGRNLAADVIAAHAEEFADAGA